MYFVSRTTDLHEALLVQFASIPDESRTEHIVDLVESHRVGQLDVCCFAARSRDHELLAVQTLVLQKDGTAHVYPVSFSQPDVLSDRSLEDDLRSEIVVELFKHIDLRFIESDAWIAQALIPAVHRSECHTLVENGYPHLTDLLFMECPLDEPRPTRTDHLETKGLSRVPYEPELESRFADLLEATYVQSADCPELNGRRTSLQALQSHKLSGKFSPLLWNLFQQDGLDVGVSLLSEHGSGVCEIVYFGLVPTTRRQGLGHIILEWNLDLAADNGNESVMLGVDVRNNGAIKMYSKAGFQEFDRRIVHARFR
jgi:GNAT superfamily N-acetyltransferase